MAVMTAKVQGIANSSIRKINKVLDNPLKTWTINTVPHPGVGLNMVAWWKCEETSGTNVADSKDSYTGTVQSTTLGDVAGKIRKGQDWSGGSGHCFTVPYSANLNAGTFSVAMWAQVQGGTGVNRAAISSRNIASSKAYGWIIYANTSNKLEFWLGTDTLNWSKVTGPSYTLNAWHHLTATYDGSDMYFYVDGTTYGPTNTAYGANTSRELRVAAGQNEGSINFEWNGLIDDVRYYNRALSSNEAAKLAGTLT